MKDTKLSRTAKPSFGKPQMPGMPNHRVTYHTISPLAILLRVPPAVRPQCGVDSTSASGKVNLTSK